MYMLRPVLLELWVMAFICMGSWRRLGKIQEVPGMLNGGGRCLWERSWYSWLTYGREAEDRELILRFFSREGLLQVHFIHSPVAYQTYNEDQSSGS